MSWPVSRAIGAWVGLMMRHAAAVIVFGVLLTAACGWYAGTHLSINTDNADLISAQVDWRQDYIAYQQAFPVFTDNLVVVVDGATPALAANAARRLAAAMRAHGDRFKSVYVPGGGEFFARSSLLYLDTPTLQRLADRLTRIQPFLGRLSADPTLATFFSLLGRAMAPDARVDFDLAPVLGQLDRAFAASRAGRFHRLSWRALMAPADAQGAATQRVILTQPTLNYAQLLPAAPAMQTVRALAQQLDLDAAHGVRVRQTGEAALSDAALSSVSKGAARAALLALLAVAVMLYLGLRSWRLMGAALASLIAGLIGTAAFAALAVGTLNLISIAFAVLYIGLGIDYAIHLCLRYREALVERAEPLSAMRTAASDVGVSLALCAITTATGFYAFVPTPYAGVAELGLISGTGMFISLLVSLTFLPALIAVMGAIRPLARSARPTRVPRIGARLQRSIQIGAVLVALACVGALPFVRFDSNTLNLNDPDSPAVKTYRELLTQSENSPLTLVTRRPDLAAAEKTANRLAALPTVASALTIDGFVPRAQQAKLAIIGDLALTLALSPPAKNATAKPQAQRRAIADFQRSLKAWLGRESVDKTKDGSRRDARAVGRRLAGTLADWRRWFDDLGAPRRQSVRGRLRADLLAGLGPQIETLMTSLQARRIDRADLPAAIQKRWIGRDGTFRVQALARGNLNDPAVLREFVASARTVAPDITGAPVLQVAAARTVSHAFAAAFVYAAVFITLLLLVLLRSVADTLRVLAPLALTALMLCAATVVLGLPFNFANVIALPLLLGLGVDSGIHVVRRLRARHAPERDRRRPLLATSTARAVVVSSLTTLAGFGSLAFSQHAGTASMGQLLALGMVAILLNTLIVVPTLVGHNNNRSGTSEYE